MSPVATDINRGAPEPSLIVVERRNKMLRVFLMVGGIVCVSAASLAYWLHGGRYVTIDNAYIRAGKLSVSTDVSGIVVDVYVVEGQRVIAGDILLRLDDRPFRNAVDAARATLAQAVLNVDAMKRDYQRMLRDVESKQSQVASDQANFDRHAGLVRSGGVTRADYDDARFRLAADRAAVESLSEQARVQLARLGGNAELEPADAPSVREKQAQLDEAVRQLDHAVIRAPFAGIATQVESAQRGMYLAAATAAFGLISTERVWVDANPKETDLTYVKVGNEVDVTVDTYPGYTWKGKVTSIAPASGAEFAILPAQNASGNWVKVVQRNPVRIEVIRRAGDPELRAGMSAIAQIDTKHVRNLADIWRR